VGAGHRRGDHPEGSVAPVKVTGGNPHITVSAVSGKTFTVSCAP
jgi:hypothetical protein